MSIRIFTFLLSLLSSYPSWSIICYFTLAKDSCWTNYNVSVDIVDSKSSKVLTTVAVPKGQQWTRQTFACEPEQKLMYIARFTPVFWQEDAGKTYPALNYWSLPNKINPGDTAWNVSVCYPSDFSLVPYPPDAKGNCKCDFTHIPIIEPGKT
jgi:hypothetical protein